MTHRRSLGSILTGLAATVVLAGCGEISMTSSDPVSPLRPAPIVEPLDVQYLPRTAVGPSASPHSPSAGGAVNDALEAHRRLTDTMERLVASQDANRQLADENRQIQADLERARTELVATQRELQDANEMLLVMREDLNEWKTNVLGYREEMQAALLAVLHSQQRVLTLLGAEPTGSDHAIRVGDPNP